MSCNMEESLCSQEVYFHQANRIDLIPKITFSEQLAKYTLIKYYYNERYFVLNTIPRSELFIYEVYFY